MSFESTNSGTARKIVETAYQVLWLFTRMGANASSQDSVPSKISFFPSYMQKPMKLSVHEDNGQGENGSKVATGRATQPFQLTSPQLPPRPSLLLRPLGAKPPVTTLLKVESERVLREDLPHFQDDDRRGEEIQTSCEALGAKEERVESNSSVIAPEDIGRLPSSDRQAVNERAIIPERETSFHTEVSKELQSRNPPIIAENDSQLSEDKFDNPTVDVAWQQLEAERASFFHQRTSFQEEQRLWQEKLATAEEERMNERTELLAAGERLKRQMQELEEWRAREQKKLQEEKEKLEQVTKEQRKEVLEVKASLDKEEHELHVQRQQYLANLKDYQLRQKETEDRNAAERQKIALEREKIEQVHRYKEEELKAREDSLREAEARMKDSVEQAKSEIANEQKSLAAEREQLQDEWKLMKERDNQLNQEKAWLTGLRGTLTQEIGRLGEETGKLEKGLDKINEERLFIEDLRRRELMKTEESEKRKAEKRERKMEMIHKVEAEKEAKRAEEERLREEQAEMERKREEQKIKDLDRKREEENTPAGTNLENRHWIENNAENRAKTDDPLLVPVPEAANKASVSLSSENTGDAKIPNPEGDKETPRQIDSQHTYDPLYLTSVGNSGVGSRDPNEFHFLSAQEWNARSATKSSMRYQQPSLPQRKQAPAEGNSEQAVLANSR